MIFFSLKSQKNQLHEPISFIKHMTMSPSERQQQSTIFLATEPEAQVFKFPSSIYSCKSRHIFCSLSRFSHSRVCSSHSRKLQTCFFRSTSFFTKKVHLTQQYKQKKIEFLNFCNGISVCLLLSFILGRDSSEQISL